MKLIRLIKIQDQLDGVLNLLLELNIKYLQNFCMNFLRIQNLTDLFLFNYYQRLTFFGQKC